MNLTRTLAAVALLGVSAAGVSAATISRHMGAQQRRPVDTSVVAPQHRHQTSPFHMLPAMRPDNRKGPVVFDGDAGFSAVLYSVVTSPPSGSLTNYYNTNTAEVQGIAQVGIRQDDQHSLYVCNTIDSNVLVLNKKGKLVSTLDDSGEYPANVALLTNGRTAKPTVYVANIFTTSTGPGSISVYANGSTTPTGTLTNSSFFQVIGVAVDSSGDVFANNDGGFFSRGSVVMFKNGSGSGTTLSNIPVSIAGGLAVDAHTQNLLVVDQGTLTVSVYAPPYTGSAIASYPIPNGGSAVDVALDKTSTNLYFGDVFGTIDVDTYPGGTYEGSYTGGSQPIGVAVRPSKGI